MMQEVFVVRDIRYAARLFARSPVFAATVISTLGLGIGLTTAVFSVVYGVLLRPLPYSESSKLVTARSVDSAALQEWTSRTAALSAIATYDMGRAPLLLAGDETVRLRQGAVSVNMLSVLGIGPMIGRDFRASDGETGAEPVVMLTYRAWQQHFGGRADVVGTLAPFESMPRRIIGVLPADFMFPMESLAVGAVAILTPISARLPLDSTFRIVGRLKPQATLAQARVEQSAIALRSASSPRVPDADIVTPLDDAIMSRHRRPLFMLFGAVGLLLLIACVNVGNLFFAKGADARRELAVRFAIGATRTRLVRLILVQSCLLSVTGGLVGILLAYISADILKSLLPTQLPRLDAIGIDHRVLGFAFMVSVVTGLVLGVFPAWRLAGCEHAGVFQSQGSATLPAQRVRSVLVATEVALAVVLVSGAALFVQSFVRLLSVDLGFVPANVLSVHVRTLQSRYPTLEHQRAFLDAAIERMRALPGVTNVAAVEMLPVTRARRGGAVVVEAISGSRPIDAEPRAISPGYFETMGIEVILGRDVHRTDDSGTPPVAVISESLARLLWPGSNPIGGRIRYENDEPREIVGVVRDVRAFAVDSAPEPVFYVPYTQNWFVPARFVIQTAGEPALAAGIVRRELHALDPRAAIESVQPLEAHVAASIANPRFQAWLLAVFGGAALLLASVGIAGAVSCTVSRRTREIAIRVALGARSREINRAVLGSSMLAILIGMLAGIGGTLVLGQLARAFLFETDPHDPLTLIGVVLILGATAMAATWLPVRRAHKVDPLIALRAE